MDSNLNTSSNNKRSASEANDYADSAINVKRSRSGKVDLRFLLASRASRGCVLLERTDVRFVLGDAGAIIGRQGKNILVWTHVRHSVAMNSGSRRS
jgi:hypothetical protein